MPVELVIGVVGLAIQAIDTSQKVKSVIEDYRSAPRDIQRLETKLGFVENQCARIKAIFRDENVARGQRLISEALCKNLLRDIDGTIKELGEILTDLQKRLPKKGLIDGPGRHFVKQKDSIQKLVAELDSDLAMLDPALTPDIYSNVESIHQTIVISPQPQKTSDALNISAPEMTPIPRKLVPFTGAETSKSAIILEKTEVRSEVSRWLFSLEVCHQQKKRTTQVRDKDECQPDRVDYETSLIFSHYISSYRVQFTWRPGFIAAPSFALSMPYVVKLCAYGRRSDVIARKIELQPGLAAHVLSDVLGNKAR
ncbi:ATP-dependent RNA helicase dbp-5 [Verticillium dahliae VDG1]|nr:ATP-dependent RNA helicase dbp-5 [Verticillium dahliae VDG1]